MGRPGRPQRSAPVLSSRAARQARPEGPRRSRLGDKGPEIVIGAPAKAVATSPRRPRVRISTRCRASPRAAGRVAPRAASMSTTAASGSTRSRGRAISPRSDPRRPRPPRLPDVADAIARCKPTSPSLGTSPRPWCPSRRPPVEVGAGDHFADARAGGRGAARVVSMARRRMRAYGGERVEARRGAFRRLDVVDGRRAPRTPGGSHRGASRGCRTARAGIHGHGLATYPGFALTAWRD